MQENKFGAILERIEDKIDILVEGQQEHGRKINILEVSVACLKEGQHMTNIRLDRIEKEMIEFKIEMSDVKKSLIRIADKLDNHQIRITKLETKI